MRPLDRRLDKIENAIDLVQARESAKQYPMLLVIYEDEEVTDCAINPNSDKRLIVIECPGRRPPEMPLSDYDSPFIRKKSRAPSKGG